MSEVLQREEHHPLRGSNGHPIKIALLLPWVGELPWYYGLFEASVRWAGIDLVLIHESTDYFRKRAERALGVTVGLKDGYKLCDLKPMYGRIFAEELTGYDYWAFGDCDVIFGRKMGEWIRRVTSEGWDVACVRKEWTSGPFTLMRNCEKVNTLFERSAKWRDVVASPRHIAFDELGPNWFLRYIYGGIQLKRLRTESDCFANVMWNAKDVRFLHEDVLCEDGLSKSVARMDIHGRLAIDGDEIPAFHMIGVKTKLSFCGPLLAAKDVGEYSLSRFGYHTGIGEMPRCLKVARKMVGASRFFCRWLRGYTVERKRVRRVIHRVLLRSPTWWKS